MGGVIVLKEQIKLALVNSRILSLYTTVYNLLNIMTHQSPDLCFLNT